MQQSHDKLQLGAKYVILFDCFAQKIHLSKARNVISGFTAGIPNATAVHLPNCEPGIRRSDGTTHLLLSPLELIEK
jgi:hypothetical protein